MTAVGGGSAGGRSGEAARLQLSARQKTLTLIACIMGSTVVTVDTTVVNVALPAIEAELGGGLAGQQWTANAYLLTLSSLILVGGSFGDLFGERRVFLAGVAGFGVTSVLCAVAPTIEVLIAARALQGVSGALLTPTALAVIVATFPGPERGRAVGQWTAWGGIGMILGPVVGGQLIDTGSWRLVFAINVPLVLVTLALVVYAIPRAADRPVGARIDVLGAGLCALGLAGATFALIQQPVLGWSHPGIVGPLVGGAAVFLLFLVYESRARHPMLPLGLFRRRNFAVGNLETFVMYGGLSMLFFFLTLFLQQVAGWSALAAGSAALPVTAVMFLLSARFGALADRLGPRLFMGGGPLVIALGFAALIRLDADVGYVRELLPAMLVFGVGLSMTVAPLTSTVLAGADAHNAGIASAVNNAIARVAGLLATAALGALVAAQFGTALDQRLAGRSLSAAAREAVQESRARPLARVDPRSLPPAERRVVAEAVEDASIGAFRMAMGVGALLVALGGVLGAIGIRDPRRRAVSARDCAGGQLAGVPKEAAGCEPPGDALPTLSLPVRESG
jgi:EmrB/QacA subfamily drug resistance transporter